MSRRQLKKISGYDETAELMKAMGVDKDRVLLFFVEIDYV